MLRTMFILCIISVGTYYALHRPLYALLFYLWNAYFRPETWIWSDFLAGAKLSFIIGCYLVITSVFSGRKLVLNTHSGLLALFLVHTAISLWISPYYAYSLPFWIEFLKVHVIGYLMLVLLQDFAQMRLVLLVMTLSLSFESAKQGWFYLLVSPGAPNMNPLPMFGDNNGVALGMLMLVPIVALLRETTFRAWARPAYVVLLIGVLYRALSTFSRGGFLAGAALAGLYWLQSRHKVRSLMALLLLLLIVSVTLPESFWTRMQTISTYEGEEDGSALGRLHFWRVALVMADAHPLFGVGLNAYNVAYDAYDFSHGQYGRMRSVHSSHLGVTAELGYLGLALYAGILVCAFYVCSRVTKLGSARPDLAHLDSTARALRTSLCVYLVGGSFLPFHYNEMLWHFIYLAFSLDKLAHLASLEPAKAPALPRAPQPEGSPSDHFSRRADPSSGGAFL